MELSPLAKRVAPLYTRLPGRLDLDDIGAKFGKQARCEGARNQLAEFKNPEALERHWRDGWW
jgi:hypothetical protein